MGAELASRYACEQVHGDDEAFQRDLHLRMEPLDAAAQLGQPDERCNYPRLEVVQEIVLQVDE